MKNINMTVEGNTLTIKIDLAQRHGLSSSKKSVIVASTGGNVKIGETDLAIGINAYSQDSKEIEAIIAKQPAVTAEPAKEG